MGDTVDPFKRLRVVNDPHDRQVRLIRSHDGRIRQPPRPCDDDAVAVSVSQVLVDTCLDELCPAVETKVTDEASFSMPVVRQDIGREFRSLVIVAKQVKRLYLKQSSIRTCKRQDVVRRVLDTNMQWVGKLRFLALPLEIGPNTALVRGCTTASIKLEVLERALSIAGERDVFIEYGKCRLEILSL